MQQLDWVFLLTIMYGPIRITVIFISFYSSFMMFAEFSIHFCITCVCHFLLNKENWFTSLTCLYFTRAIRICWYL